jgi:hypothetical protein
MTTGTEVRVTTPTEFTATLHTDQAIWSKLVKESGAKVE